MFLETPRLNIHEFAPEFFSSVHEYAVDPEVYQFQHWGPNTEAETKSFIDHCIAQISMQPRNVYELAISLKNGTHIGGVRIGIESTMNRSANIGYTLRKDQWGKGYGTEAARGILEFGFKELGLHRIYATADPENVASIRVLEKCGMRKEGLLKENLLVRGKWRDSLLLAIVESEFTPRLHN